MLVGLVNESLMSGGLGDKIRILLGCDGEAGEITGFDDDALKVVSSGCEKDISACSRGEDCMIGSS